VTIKKTASIRVGKRGKKTETHKAKIKGVKKKKNKTKHLENSKKKSHTKIGFRIGKRPCLIAGSEQDDGGVHSP
jgi:hypothetical protein